MSFKKTKGKQKITIKKIEKDSFGSPSFRAVTEQYLIGEASSSSSSSTLPKKLLDHQKMQMEELCKSYNILVEKTIAAKQKAKKMALLAEALPVESDAWWRVEPEEVKDKEEVKKLLKKYEELFDKLHEELVIRISGGGDAGK